MNSFYKAVSFCFPDIVAMQKALLKGQHSNYCDNPLADVRRPFVAKKTPRLMPNTGTLRSDVCWLPAPSATKNNTAEALDELANYTAKNNIGPPPKKNIRRQRAKSMFQDRSEQPIDLNEKAFTMDDMHSEFKAKYNRPNRGLKPSDHRQLDEPQPQALSQRQRIYQELQAKIAAKATKK